ncbi:MAG: hypothetical protein P1P85_05745 [Patescibacteria group bacterium]|nr:hypothetical protein [Patescibacteria group bacterium]
MTIKITKTLILLIVVFTLLLSLTNLAFVTNYQNTYGKYNKTIINNAGNDISKLEIACRNVNQPIEEYLIYEKITLWSFIAIMILIAIVFIEFALVKSKIISFSPKDWKYLKIIILVIFLSSVIFVYTPLIMEDNSYVAPCWEIWYVV